MEWFRKHVGNTCGDSAQSLNSKSDKIVPALKTELMKPDDRDLEEGEVKIENLICWTNSGFSKYMPINTLQIPEASSLDFSYMSNRTKPAVLPTSHGTNIDVQCSASGNESVVHPMSKLSNVVVFNGSPTRSYAKTLPKSERFDVPLEVEESCKSIKPSGTVLPASQESEIDVNGASSKRTKGAFLQVFKLSDVDTTIISPRGKVRILQTTEEADVDISSKSVIADVAALPVSEESEIDVNGASSKRTKGAFLQVSKLSNVDKTIIPPRGKVRILQTTEEADVDISSKSVIADVAALPVSEESEIDLLQSYYTCGSPERCEEPLFKELRNKPWIDVSNPQCRMPGLPVKPQDVTQMGKSQTKANREVIIRSYDKAFSDEEPHSIRESINITGQITSSEPSNVPVALRPKFVLAKPSVVTPKALLPLETEIQSASWQPVIKLQRLILPSETDTQVSIASPTAGKIEPKKHRRKGGNSVTPLPETNVNSPESDLENIPEVRNSPRKVTHSETQNKTDTAKIETDPNNAMQKTFGSNLPTGSENCSRPKRQSFIKAIGLFKAEETIGLDKIDSTQDLDNDGSDSDYDGSDSDNDGSEVTSLGDQNDKNQLTGDSSCTPNLLNKCTKKKKKTTAKKLKTTAKKLKTTAQKPQTTSKKLPTKVVKKTNFFCDTCENYLFSQDKLVWHKYRIHGKIPEKGAPVKCNICTRLFLTETGLGEHMYYVHESCQKKIKPKKYLCDICEKEFSSKGWLVRHKEIYHCQDKQCVCEVCGRVFHDRDKLSMHMDNHKKRYKCDTCNTIWSTSYNLKTHMLSHTGEKPHKCEVCEQAFSRSDNLKLHLKLMHKDVPRYKCKKCGEKFHTNKEKVEHYRTTHPCKNVSKLLECKFCGKMLEKRDFGPHIKLHEKGKLIKCEKCEKHVHLTSVRYKYKIEEKDDTTLTVCHACFEVYATQFKPEDYTSIRQKCVVQEHCKYCGKSFYLKYLSEGKHHEATCYKRQRYGGREGNSKGVSDVPRKVPTSDE